MLCGILRGILGNFLHGILRGILGFFKKKNNLDGKK